MYLFIEALMFASGLRRCVHPSRIIEKDNMKSCACHGSRMRLKTEIRWLMHRSGHTISSSSQQYIHPQPSQIRSAVWTRRGRCTAPHRAQVQATGSKTLNILLRWLVWLEHLVLVHQFVAHHISCHTTCPGLKSVSFCTSSYSQAYLSACMNTHVWVWCTEQVLSRTSMKWTTKVRWTIIYTYSRCSHLIKCTTLIQSWSETRILSDGMMSWIVMHGCLCSSRVNVENERM